MFLNPGVIGCYGVVECFHRVMKEGTLTYRGFLTRRVHLYYHYGVASQKTVPIMVLGAYFHNSRVYLHSKP